MNMSVVSYYQPSVVTDPRNGSFYFPSFSISSEFSSILSFRFSTICFMRNNQVYSTLFDLGKVSWTRVKPRKIDIIKTFFRILRDSDSQCSNVASRYCKKSRRNQKSSILLPFWFLVSYLKNILFSVYAKDFL